MKARTKATAMKKTYAVLNTVIMTSIGSPAIRIAQRLRSKFPRPFHDPFVADLQVPRVGQSIVYSVGL